MTPEAAYNTLADVAIEARKASAVPEALASRCPRERMILVHQASKYVRQFALPPSLERILKTDVLEPEDNEEVEHVLCQIDELEAVVGMCVRMVREYLEDARHRQLLTDLVQMRLVASELVRRLSARPDIVSVASRIVLNQREPEYLPDGRPLDWFARWRSWDSTPSLRDILLYPTR